MLLPDMNVKIEANDTHGSFISKGMKSNAQAMKMPKLSSGDGKRVDIIAHFLAAPVPTIGPLLWECGNTFSKSIPQMRTGGLNVPSAKDVSQTRLFAMSMSIESI